MKNKARKTVLIRRAIVLFILLISLFVLFLLLHLSSKKVEIKINGDENVTVPWAGEYVDPGAEAVSYYSFLSRNEKELSVKVSGEVNTRKSGIYEIVYTASDGKNEKTAVRTVNVLKISEEQVAALLAIRDEFNKKTAEELPEDAKIIYLTFDDGPGAYTERLLDLLDSYDIKATFFVTNGLPDYREMIAEEYRRGHSVCVHTLTHKPDIVYASDEAFWQDIEAMNDIVEEQTGKRSDMIRFLGGSSNTISSTNPGIMTRLTQQAAERGYQYFDWNVSSGDSDGTKTKEGCLKNLQEGCMEHRVNVALCHDVKSYLIDAMEDFIPWALDNGYTFLPLYKDSPSAHHRVFN